ncbi:MAG: 50S ribosomal protein L4 [Nanoarchaeota archaeon]|nr:50S ribosomal protein L4 [Nanoarchaeota archaeon]
MVKTILYDIKGKKKGNVELPNIFASKIREDIVAKYLEVSKFIQPYATDPEAGKKHSASGTISHKRHDWKGHYGRGISRIPRKTMWRRGTQFMWIGAEVSSTRGGRRSHPPKGIGKEKKINKKEIKLAMNSAFAATADDKYILKRYDSINKLNIKVPIVIESGLDEAKTKDILSMLKNILGEFNSIIFKNKKIRAGRGKSRGRKYKSNAGLLLVKGKDEKIKMSRVDIKSINEISILDLYPLGRLTVYTEKALEELGDKK